MDCTVEIACPDIDSESLHELTRQLAASVNEETEVRADIPEQAPRPGERGEPITLGVLALSFISSGAAVALFQVFKALFERNDSLELSIEHPDGRKLSIKAANVDRERIGETMAAARDFFRESP